MIGMETSANYVVIQRRIRPSQSAARIELTI